MIRRLHRAIINFRELVKDPRSKTYYLDEKLKPKWRITLDHLYWVIKHRELHHHYYDYGFDRAGFNRFDAYLPEQKFCKLRDRMNRCYQVGNRQARYICMLQDKFLFGRYLTGLGFSTPEILALCTENEILWLSSGHRERYDQLHCHEGLNAFFKLAVGRCAEGVFTLRISDGQIRLNDRPVSWQDMQEKAQSSHYLIQRRVRQHPEMSRMYPHSVNTTRLVTIRKKGAFVAASSTLRTGACGNHFDNWGGGGVAVGIDRRTGDLKDWGISNRFGGRVDRHPETGVVFRGFRIPYFREAVQAACELHSFFYGVHSIGWDIAITPDGPTFVEGNNCWAIEGQQLHDPTIKRTFLESLKCSIAQF